MGSYEQSEALTTRLGNIIKDYNAAQTLQELLQNCDDARAPHVAFLLDKRSAAETGWSLKSLQEAAPEQLAANPSTQSLVVQKNLDADWLMQQFSGPALYQYDYGVFEPEDFQSLSNLGDGRKKCDPTKTGKFCLGFNCVYHLTDLPCFASGHHCVFLDPHKRIFACKDGDMQSAVGGWRFDTSDPSLNQALGPIFEPFRCNLDPLPHEGYTPWDPNESDWKGTIFKLPLRSTSDANRSLIMDKSQGAAHVMTPEKVEKEVLEPFMENAVERLLFMRIVESIKIYVWEEGASKAEQVFSLSITDLDDDKRMLRKKMVTFVKDEMQRFQNEVDAEERDGPQQRKNEAFLRFMRNLRTRLKEAPRVLLPMRVKTQRKGTDAVIDHWALSTMIGSEDEIDFATADQYDGEDGPAKNEQAMWPYAAVAAHLASGTERDGCYVQCNHGRIPRMNGRAFCTLPTPIRTGLPVHVDSRWELKVDRNNLVLDHTCRGTDMQRTHWNYVLLERVVAVAYARLLQALTMPAVQSDTLRNWLCKDGIRLRSQDFYRLFPQSPKNPEDFFARVAKPVFHLLANPCGVALPVEVASRKVIPQSSINLDNYDRAWRFFFDSQAEAQAGVQFLHVVQANEQLGETMGEDAAHVFARFDKEGAGFLSKEDLKRALREVMDEAAVEDLDFEKLWEAGDKSLDGYIDETEFRQVMSLGCETTDPTAIRRTLSGRSIKADLMVSDFATVVKRQTSRCEVVENDRDEFSGLQGISFRLVGVDKAIASVFAKVDEVLANKTRDVADMPQHWAKAKNIIYRIFGSACSVEESLLHLGMRLTDAPPEMFEELRSFGATRVRPTHVRHLLNIAQGRFTLPEIQAPRVGDRVITKQDMERNGKALPKGIVACVVQVDDNGDAWIDFEGTNVSSWKFEPEDFSLFSQAALPAALIPKPLNNEQAMLSLLMYCLSDQTNDDALTEMRGCVVLPLQDGSIAPVPHTDTHRSLLIDTDAFAIAKPSGKPFGRLLIENPQVFLTRPASLVLTSLNEAKSFRCELLPKSLGCMLFSPEVLSLYLEDAFPANWKQRRCVPAHKVTSAIREKLHIFWEFLQWYSRSVELPRPSQHFKLWPLLPVADGRLIRLNLVDVVLHVLDTPDSKASPVYERIIVFEKLGVPLVRKHEKEDESDMTQNAFALIREESSSALPELLNAQHACKSLLHWISKQPFPEILASDRCVLLQLLTQAKLDKQQLNQVRSLPLFELLDTPGQFTALNAACSYYMMADFSIEGFEIRAKQSVCFLKEPQPEWSSLYMDLGVVRLPREVFYVEYCFDSFQSLPDGVRLALFCDIRENFEHVRNKIVKDLPFSTLLKSAALFGDSLSVCDLLKPNDELVQQDLNHGLEKRLPPLALRSQDWVRVLESWGMPAQLPMCTLLGVAKAIEQREDLDAAEVLLRYFTVRYASLQQQEDPATWQVQLRELSELRLISNEQQTRRHCRSPSLRLPQPSDQFLVALRGCRLLNAYTVASMWSQEVLVWSQETLVHWPGALPPNDALESLGLLQGLPPFETVLKQYSLVKAEMDRQLEKGPLTGKKPAGIRELEILYEFFNAALRESPECAENLRQAGIDRDSDCVFVDIGDGAPQWSFVKPNAVFTGWEKWNSDKSSIMFPGAGIYVLTYSSPLYSYYSLHRHLNIRYSPNAKELMGALQNLGRKLKQIAEGREIATKTKLQQSMISIAHLLGEQAEKHEGLLLIDEQFRVAPITKLLIDDAPWLEDRLDRNALPLLHKSLHVYHRRLGIALLSEVVREELVSVERAPHEKLGPQLAARLSDWQKLCSCSQFRSGLWRLQLESATQRKVEHEAQQHMKLRLYELGRLEIVAVTAITSRFLIWDRDVTATEVGSPSFIGLLRDKLCIYLTRPAHGRHTVASILRSWERQLIMQLDRYFHCNNSYYISELLRVSDGDEIESLLNEMRIPAGVLDENDQLIGMPIQDDLNCLVSDSNSPDVDLGSHTGKLVVVECQAGDFRFAMLCDFVESGNVRLDVGSEIGVVVFPRESVWLMKSKSEMAEERAKNAEMFKKVQDEQMPPRSEVDERTSDAELLPGADEAESPSTSELVEYSLGEDWYANETQLREQIRANRQQRAQALVKEPSGVGLRDVSYVDVGDNLQAQYSEENSILKELFLSEATVGMRSSVGYDLVLIGNFDEQGKSPEEIPFYHHRLSKDEFGDERKALLVQCCHVLRELAEKVFNYPVYNIALFYQPRSTSRFIRQQILINIWPIEVHCQEKNIRPGDIALHPFAYLYMYGLLIHKFAHFFDLVHGTRHDFYMNEIRIEHLMEWLDLLESKGWDPAALEKENYKTGETYTKLLMDVVL